MKRKLLFTLIVVLQFGYVHAQDESSLKNVWTLTQIKTPKNDIDYRQDSKKYTLTIEDGSLRFIGSCTPCWVNQISVDKTSISYKVATECEPGCCFFDNPKQDLIKFAQFNGFYLVKGDELTIINDTTTYSFVLKK